MFLRHIIQRTVPIGACAATILSYAAPARAGKRAVCTAAYTAYKDALQQEKLGHLREARELLQTCMQATVCGGLLPKCTAKYSELPTGAAAPTRAAVSADICTVVLVATNENGAPLVDVDVKVDGRALTSHLDGKALPVEAGAHEFTFSTDRGVFATQKVMVLEGQRNRVIAVSMGGAKPAATTASDVPAQVVGAPSAASHARLDGVRVEDLPALVSEALEARERRRGDNGEGNARSTTDTRTHAQADDQPVQGDSAAQAGNAREEPGGGGGWAMPKSVLPYVHGGVGFAGLAAGGLLTYWGNQDNNSLRNSCGVTAQCDPSSVDHIRKLYLVSDLSYGVGAAALVVTTFLFATSRSAETTVKPAVHDALVVGVQPIHSGGFASVSGKF